MHLIFQACALMDSSDLSPGLRLYLPLFLEYILECPVQRGEKLIEPEVIAAELERDLISVYSSLGIESENRFACGNHSFAIALCLEVRNFSISSVLLEVF